MPKPEIEAAQKAIRNLRGRGMPTDFALANDAVHAAEPFIRAQALAEFGEALNDAYERFGEWDLAVPFALDHLAAREEGNDG